MLASRFSEFSSVPLKRYANGFYLSVIRYRKYLPDRIRRFMWHFIGTNRLARYGTMAGIRESVGIMVRIGRITLSVDEVMQYLAEHELRLMAVFRPFFSELQAYCAGYINLLPVSDRQPKHPEMPPDQGEPV